MEDNDSPPDKPAHQSPGISRSRTISDGQKSSTSRTENGQASHGTFPGSTDPSGQLNEETAPMMIPLIEIGTSKKSKFTVSPSQVHYASPVVTPASQTSNVIHAALLKEAEKEAEGDVEENLSDNSTIGDYMENNMDTLFSFENEDENQRTVQSFGGFSIDTQDSDRYKIAPFLCGNIQFLTDMYDLDGEELKKHYMCIPPDASSESVSRFMSTFWRLKSPKIVLSIMSDVENFKPWKSLKLKDDFQKGIIKAANTTNMWIVTDGLDGGVTKMIGDAIKEEKIQQMNTKSYLHPYQIGSASKKKNLTIIGIVAKEAVAYGFSFDGSDGVRIKNEGTKPTADNFELNPNHTHFMLVEDEGKDYSISQTIRFSLEKQFQVKCGHGLHRRRLMSMVSDDRNPEEEVPVIDMRSNKVPVVGLLVQGSPSIIDHVLFYLQHNMPVLVLKGSGGLADIVAYTYEEIQDRGDEDFQENFLKPELIKMITKFFPKDFIDNDFDKFYFRDKIIECAQLASEGEQSFITIINIKGWGSSLKDLDKFILRALFRSEKFERSEWREQLQSDLQLTMDWNRPDLAAEIFHRGDYTRVRIQKNLFEQSLLKQDREEFVELFLEQGCKVHRFLNHRKLKLLFEKADDREFFINICLEKILGLLWIDYQTLDDDFISEHLNRLIYKLTGISDFVKLSQLSLSWTGMSDIDPILAERRALTCLTVWAILMNRSKLAKALWQRTDQPIGLGLICCMMYKELAKYVMEMHLREEMERNSKEFGQMALGVLAICFRDSNAQAYGMLSKTLPDFDNKTVIQIAHDAEYIHFMAHPCCQKWLTREFFGCMQVIELDYGFFRLPYWFKILSSVFLVFPMNIWIIFNPVKKKSIKVSINAARDQLQSPDEDSSEEEIDDDHFELAKSKSVLKAPKKTFMGISSTLKGVLNLKKKKKNIPMYRKYYLLWTAPITKFWMTTMCYFLYLGLFCVATLWPTCGNFFVDMVLWFWTVIILLELVSRTYIKYHKYRTMPLMGHSVEIVLIVVFLILHLFSRLFQNVFDISQYIRSKALMSFALLFFFYRLLGFYLPISPTLGPMLLRLNRMIKKDFSVFIRMFLLFMISGGVTIQAVLYPHFPLGIELIKRVLTRPLFAMFLTQIQDLDGYPECSPLYKNITDNFCATENNLLGTKLNYVDPQIAPLQMCPFSSLPGYLIPIIYLLICKLVLVTLLFAMFSLTISQVDKEAREIWKFQRYALIVDFAERYTLPPPFTIFNFIHSCIVFIYNSLQGCRKKCNSFCCCRKKKSVNKIGKSNRTVRAKRSEEFNYWKRCTREFITNEDQKKETEEMPVKQGELLLNLQEDLKAHRKSMKLLSDRVVELERMTKSSRMYLEDIAHKLDKTEVMGITNVKGNFIHVAARQSPYPGTRKTRFPVFDKYVPWEHFYDVYDPKTYTLPRNQFPETEVHFVDEDILELKIQADERATLTVEERDALSPLPSFKPIWNSVVSYKGGGVKQEADRRSWITKDDQPLRYELDPIGLPMNPMGRTGMRGKGMLWRWGPNHVIKAVVTRWRRKYGPDLCTLPDFLYVEGKRVLEFIAVQKTDAMESCYRLPGEMLHGISNSKSQLCKAFVESVFDETDANLGDKLDEGDMIQFFAQFASVFVGGSTLIHARSLESINKMRPAGLLPVETRLDSDQPGFRASLIYKGYLDDPRNTDNAWVETEVWNFHYDLGDTFDIRLQEEGSVKWKEVSPYVRLFGNETVIVQEAARIHDSYY